MPATHDPDILPFRSPTPRPTPEAGNRCTVLLPARPAHQHRVMNVDYYAASTPIPPILRRGQSVHAFRDGGYLLIRIRVTTRDPGTPDDLVFRDCSGVAFAT